MTFKIYRDEKGEWRWHLIARNGRILADSGEGYKRRGKAIRMIEKIILDMDSAKIEES